MNTDSLSEDLKLTSASIRCSFALNAVRHAPHLTFPSVDESKDGCKLKVDLHLGHFVIWITKIMVPGKLNVHLIL